MGISRNHLYDQVEIFNNHGTFTWAKPSNIDDSKPVLVHVWGAGGTGGDNYNYTAPGNDPGAVGGGAGGLAVKAVDVSALGSTETVTIGSGHNMPDVAGGTSSFGSHCSATGGNGGAFNTANTSGLANNATHQSPTIANPVAGTTTDLGGKNQWRNNGTGSGTNYWGQGGMGIGGDINRRGGWGGTGYYAGTNNNGGGGGGSAPAPYGWSHGFDGGSAYTYAGGGGGGIGQYGSRGNYASGVGGGTAGGINQVSNSPTSYYVASPGGTGVAGHGGTPGKCYIAYISYGGDVGMPAEPGQGLCLIEPNQILFGGGGGGGMIEWYTQSSGYNSSQCGHGGPGAGGGGSGAITSQTSTYTVGGMGGILGGGGGGYQYTAGGNGGNAAGGGGSGYYAGANTPADDQGNVGGSSYMFYGCGGDGLVILQYATK